MDAADNQENLSNEKNYYILKGRFKSSSLNFYGLFLLIYNTREELSVHHVIVSTYSSVYEHEPHVPWFEYEELIVNSKWKGNYNANMTLSIEEDLKKFATDNSGQREILYGFIKKYDYENTDLFMFDILNRVIHDKNLIMETGIQEVTEAEFRESKDKKQSETISTKSDLKLEEGSVTLTIQLILAPVSGKPIYELKVGDKIMTKIKPDSDRANYFIDLLNLRVENHVKPVPGEVIDIKSGGKTEPLEILTKMGPGIYGKCVEEERQVKLRMYDPRIDAVASRDGSRTEGDKKITPQAKESDLNARIEGFPKITYAIIGLLIVLFAIFLALFIFT